MIVFLQLKYAESLQDQDLHLSRCKTCSSDVLVLYFPHTYINLETDLLCFYAFFLFLSF